MILMDWMPFCKEKVYSETIWIRTPQDQGKSVQMFSKEYFLNRDQYQYLLTVPNPANVDENPKILNM